jgi:hypothetical protein
VERASLAIGADEAQGLVRAKLLDVATAHGQSFPRFRPRGVRGRFASFLGTARMGDRQGRRCRIS